MSGIASISSSTSAQRNYPPVSGALNSAAGAPSIPATTANSPASSDTTNAARTNSQATAPLSDLRQQLETAITQGVDQLPAGSSPQDIFQAIRSAVESTLKANGIDSQRVPGLSGQHGHHHSHHAQGAGQAAGGAASSGSTTDSDGDGDGDSATATDPLLAPGTTSADALTQLLQGLSAGENSASAPAAGNSTNSNPITAGNGSSSRPNLSAIFRQLFQGFPNGTGLDVLA